MTEDWRWIPGYEGLYQVSSLGRVASVPGRRRRERLVFSPEITGAGYRRATLCRDGARSRASIHVLVLLAFAGPRPPGAVCRHLDGDRKNNQLANLRWGTQEENCADRARHGRTPRSAGIANGAAKLTAASVREIRQRYAAGELQAGLAAEYGVVQSRISAIVRRASWRHVQ